jgi:tRNA threonylcarbamoyladenosine biosynthesis protein TsaE
MTDGPIQLITSSADETVMLGTTLSRWLEPGDVVLLHGDLGAGKTTLAKGIAAALGTDALVSSPSFALVNEYPLGPDSPIKLLYHLDLYRIDEGELDTIGLAELLNSPTAVSLVEWPERAEGQLPERYLLIELIAVGEEQRQVRFIEHPTGDRWRRRLRDLRRRLPSADPR